MASGDTENVRVVVLRRRGAQPPFDVLLVADELERLQAGATVTRLLFDWSLVDHWRFDAPSVKEVEHWRANAPKIARAAIVHALKWKSQAALVSALLRTGNTQVRCFRPAEYEKAVEWLSDPL